MNPEFSLITVSYNSEKTIARTIDSVLEQTFKSFEYIIIDGASSDKTNEIIERYKDKFGENLTHISESDAGIYDAMNKGIRLAKGKIIGIINSDDYLLNDTLAIVHNAYINLEKTTVISGELKFVSDKKQQLLKNSKKRFERKIAQYKNGVRHPATFVPREVYNKVGLFNLNYKISADADLIYRIYLKNYSFKFINKPLAVMSDGGISNSKGIFMQTLREKKLFLKSYCPNAIWRFYFTLETIAILLMKRISPKLISLYRSIDNRNN